MRIAVVRLASDQDFAALEPEWRSLEAVADGSIFQSWTWIGCRLRHRFTDPFLVRASEGSEVVGLALFNRRGSALFRTLWLHETGSPAEDSVFIEHNGPLLARGRQALLEPMLSAALRHGRLMLSGVSDTVRDAARAIGLCHVTASRPAPCAVFEDATEESWLANLGASTRYQLRRSRRRYEAHGPLIAERAGDVEQGLAFLTELAALHQARWVARNRPGAFAEPAFFAFHRALVAQGLPRGEVDLWRVSVSITHGMRVIGYLYNLRWRDQIYAYQGGFAYADHTQHEKPGLTCHHAAIAAAIASKAARYDFLAGEARYKRNFASVDVDLHWLDLQRAHALSRWRNRVRHWFRSGRREEPVPSAASQH